MSAIQRYQNVSRGFTLIEIAVVLLIISILITMVAVPLSTQLDVQKTVDTNRQLEQIKEAIYGFAMANGRLPCASRLADNGVESVVSPTTGVCNAYSGFLPAVTLGIAPIDSAGFAVDAWGLQQNRIRYAVIRIDPALALGANCLLANVNEPMTRTGGMSAATMACLAGYNNDTTPLPLITVCGTSPTTSAAWPQAYCTASKLTITAPFVLISQGKNAASSTSAAVGSDEEFNAVSSGQKAVFVSHTPSPTGAPGGEFDDLVTWGSLNTLFARMVQAGKLP